MIERVIKQVLAAAPLSTGDNLLGFEIDFAEFVGRRFHDVSVRRTKDPAWVLDARAAPGKRISSLQDVSRRLQAVWAAIAYPEFEASSCVWYREATVFRFVTAVSSEGLCVTGRIVVSGGPYDRMVRVFERDFHRLDSLPAMESRAQS